MSTLAVIPTLVAPDGLRGLVRSLEASGAKVRVVANSARAATRLLEWQVPHMDLQLNLGFGGSVRAVVAEENDWDSLIIANDDLVVEESRFSSSMTALSRNSGVRYLCPEPPRALPGLIEVFLNLSLLGRLLGRLGARRPVTGMQYRSFSMVEISRSCWDDVGGLDPDIPFTFEDADFIRRATQLGYAAVASPDLAIAHRHSEASAQYIREVLPVSAWSAVAYLDKWRGKSSANLLTVRAALIARIPLLLFAKARFRDHLVGVLRAISASGRHVPPALPKYEQIQ
ncbi:glycosyltransferase family 2 protein [Protaetiibacter intestinalis]|uniref:glycosyltransferase family 2 protein n=1 Tax=Protaetiibacter intestinalis TaxID=2419774 RepID=UPI0013006462|nr:hypothetical protein [Protaetiibacter intestinalis]